MLPLDAVSDTTNASIVEQLETLSRFTKHYQTFLESFKNSKLGAFQEEAEKLLGQMQDFNKHLVGAALHDQENLSTRLEKACAAGDVEAANALFTEIKTTIVAKSGTTITESPFVFAETSQHYLYRYLELAFINGHYQLKLIVFPLLHAAALTKREEELDVCLYFINENKMMKELFTTGDCCFIFKDGTKLFFYRRVLAHLLPYFQNLLTGKMLEANAKAICIGDDRDPILMQQILEMLYGSYESFQAENLLLYLQEAAYMNAPSLTENILNCYYKELTPDHETDAELLFTLFTFAQEQNIASLKTFVLYWTVFQLIHGKTLEGPLQELLKILGDNVTHMGNERHDDHDNYLPKWLILTQEI